MIYHNLFSMNGFSLENKNLLSYITEIIKS